MCCGCCGLSTKAQILAGFLFFSGLFFVAISIFGCYSETKRYLDMPKDKRDLMQIAIAYAGNLIPAAIGAVAMRIAMAGSHIGSYIIAIVFVPLMILHGLQVFLPSSQLAYLLECRTYAQEGDETRCFLVNIAAIVVAGMGILSGILLGRQIDFDEQRESGADLEDDTRELLAPDANNR